MFPENRQNKLNPILERLRAIPGVKSVQQDDFDSAGINVFLDLEMKGNRFVKPLSSFRPNIKKAIGGAFDFLDFPKAQYKWSPSGPGLPRERYFDGYDVAHFKLNIFV